MFKYYNELIICNQLNNKNREQEELIKQLQKEKKELQYKYDGLLECKNDIYTKYQDTIISKSKSLE